MMHPIIGNEVAKARIADWHRQAERDRLARAARLTRKTPERRSVPSDLATVLARRVRAMLAAPSPRPRRSQPAQAPKVTP
jgi:hypothetical protein